MILGNFTRLSHAEIENLDLVTIEPRSMVEIADCILHSEIDPPVSIAPEARLSLVGCVLFGTWGAWYQEHRDEVSGGNNVVMK